MNPRHAAIPSMTLDFCALTSISSDVRAQGRAGQAHFNTSATAREDQPPVQAPGPTRMSGFGQSQQIYRTSWRNKNVDELSYAVRTVIEHQEQLEAATGVLRRIHAGAHTNNPEVLVGAWRNQSGPHQASNTL